METIYLSLRPQVAVGTFLMKPQYKIKVSLCLIYLKKYSRQSKNIILDAYKKEKQKL